MAARPEFLPSPNLPGYAFGETLGSGSFGTVYKARLLTNRPNDRPIFHAIKCLKRKSLNKTTEDLLVNEIKLLKNIKHENIVEMFDFQWDEHYIYIVMEYCAGGDMSRFIRSRQRLTEARARPFVQQIARVIKFLYEKKISHMDLKPENILLTSTNPPVLKVADFGVAQHIGRQGSRSVRGTLLYMAPEILSTNPYDNRVDLWSIGVILYECLFGHPLFVFSNVDELVEQICSRQPIEIPTEPPLSSDCRDLLVGLLKRNPENRITFRDFFKHPFVVPNLNAEIERAKEIFHRSLRDEESGNLREALDNRLRALDSFAAIIKIDEDPDRKESLRRRVRDGLSSAEALKRKIREKTPVSPTSPSETTSRPRTATFNSANVDLSHDQKLSDAYQHCLNGNHLMDIQRFGQACEEYQIGLQVMLQASRTETDPKKTKILHDVITCYLKRAELCKEKVNAQQIDQNIENLKDLTIDDSSEKRSSLMMSTQNCLLQ